MTRNRTILDWNVEAGLRLAHRIQRDARLVRDWQDSFLHARGWTRAAALTASKATRDTLSGRWNVSRERSELDRALASTADLPFAGPNLLSYRYSSSLGAIYIGATDDDDALREAARSIAYDECATIRNLEVWDWDAGEYVSAAY